MEKYTATEWLFNKLWDEPKDKFNWNAILSKAKEMEKRQIINACNQEECFGSSGYGIHEDITKGEEYYNVTFKNK
jgi:hypothetical protein